MTASDRTIRTHAFPRRRSIEEIEEGTVLAPNSIATG